MAQFISNDISDGLECVIPIHSNYTYTNRK